MIYRSHDHDLDRVVAFLVQALTDQAPHPRTVITHSLRVGLYLEQHRWLQSMVLAGLLHEVTEASDRSLAILTDVFSPEVAHLVAANLVDQRRDRLEQALESMQRYKRLGRAALIVKAADLLDHVEHDRDEAQPEWRTALSRMLKTFLDLSAPELRHEPVWHSLHSRYLELTSFWIRAALEGAARVEDIIESEQPPRVDLPEERAGRRARQRTSWKQSKL